MKCDANDVRRGFRERETKQGRERVNEGLVASAGFFSLFQVPGPGADNTHTRNTRTAAPVRTRKEQINKMNRERERDTAAEQGMFLINFYFV